MDIINFGNHEPNQDTSTKKESPSGQVPIKDAVGMTLADALAQRDVPSFDFRAPRAAGLYRTANLADPANSNL